MIWVITIIVCMLVLIGLVWLSSMCYYINRLTKRVETLEEVKAQHVLTIKELREEIRGF